MRKTLWPQSCPLTWYCDGNMCKMNTSSIFIDLHVNWHYNKQKKQPWRWKQIYLKYFENYLTSLLIKKFNMVSLMYHQHAWILIPEMSRYTTKHALIFHDLHISFIKLWNYPYVPLLWVHYTIWNIFHECRNVLYEFIAVNDPPEEKDNTNYHSFFLFQILHFVTQLCFFQIPLLYFACLTGK